MCIFIRHTCMLIRILYRSHQGLDLDWDGTAAEQTTIHRASQSEVAIFLNLNII